MNNNLPLMPVAALLAVAAGAAQAQSNVTVYGVIDAGLYAKQLSGATRDKTVDSGLMETSHIGFKGSGDLGSGLRANFDISSFLRPADGGATRGIPGESFWSKTAMVGLASPWGAVRMGRISTPNFINTIRFNPFGASSALSPSFLHTYVGSAAQPMATGSGSTDSAWNNSLAYTSPVFGGAVASLQVADNQNGSGRRLGAGLSYGAGPFAAMLTADHITNATLASPLRLPTLPGAVPPFTAKRFDTWQLGASYDLKVVKLYGQYVATSIDGTRPGPTPAQTLALKTLQLGLSAPLGSGKLLASAARTGLQRTTAADLHRNTIALGYDHDLSKRTDLYAVLMHDKVSDLASGTGLVLGMRHRY